MSALARFVSSDDVDATIGAVPGRNGDADPLAGVAAPLRRFLQPRETPVGEACEFCAKAVPGEHRHVVDLEQRGMLCACRGCALLFVATGTAEVPGRYRAVPERYLRVEPFMLDTVDWASLQIPVGMAFVVDHAERGPVAFYPSPGGATESELALDSWSRIVVANPVLDELEPDVEAALVRSEREGPPTCFVVPVDRCYELVGHLRLQWRGFDGGQDVRSAIDAFFSDIGSRARTVTRESR